MRVMYCVEFDQYAGVLVSCAAAGRSGLEYDSEYYGNDSVTFLQLTMENDMLLANIALYGNILV